MLSRLRRVRGSCLSLFTPVRLGGGSRHRALAAHDVRELGIWRIRIADVLEEARPFPRVLESPRFEMSGEVAVAVVRDVVEGPSANWPTGVVVRDHPQHALAGFGDPDHRRPAWRTSSDTLRPGDRRRGYVRASGQLALAQVGTGAERSHDAARLVGGGAVIHSSSPA